MLRLFLPLVCCLAPILVAQEVSLQTEAARFAKESRFLERINKPDDAIEKIEVAIALDPEKLSDAGRQKSDRRRTP